LLDGAAKADCGEGSFLHQHWLTSAIVRVLPAERVEDVYLIFCKLRPPGSRRVLVQEGSGRLRVRRSLRGVHGVHLKLSITHRLAVRS